MGRRGRAHRRYAVHSRTRLAARQDRTCAGGAFRTSLWLSVDGPGPDGLTVMREDSDRDSVKSPPLEPPRFFTATGAVRTWHDEQGWGVLDADSTPGGAWAHFSTIVGEGFRRLDPGQRVEFDYEPAIQDGFRFQAVTVRTL